MGREQRLDRGLAATALRASLAGGLDVGERRRTSMDRVDDRTVAYRDALADDGHVDWAPLGRDSADVREA